MRFVILALVSAQWLTAGDMRLIEAVKDQDHKAVDSLLQAHVDVNVSQPDGATPLAWAVYLNQADVVDALLKAGSKVNTADEYGETPLTLACGTGNAMVIERLLGAGADATAARWNGETALMIAARSGCADGVKALLAHGAKLDAVDSQKGQNALMWAAAEGHSDVVKALIEAGANVKTASKGGFSPLVFAAQKGDADSVSSLLRAGANVNDMVPAGFAVLEIAALGGRTKAAEVLLNRGAKLDAADKTGNTALHVAAQLGNVDLAKMLLAKGANPNVKNAVTESSGRSFSGGSSFFRQPGEQTPLLFAARFNHEDVMRALIAGGADPALKAQDGMTLLMAAAGSGHVETVQYAYELDSDIQAKTETGRTVMHSSVLGSMNTSTQAEICKVVQFLADKGAELDPSDSNGRTPLMLADLLPIDKAVELLTKLIKQSGAKPKQASRR